MNQNQNAGLPSNGSKQWCSYPSHFYMDKLSGHGSWFWSFMQAFTPILSLELISSGFLKSEISLSQN